MTGFFVPCPFRWIFFQLDFNSASWVANWKPLLGILVVFFFLFRAFKWRWEGNVLLIFTSLKNYIFYYSHLRTISGKLIFYTLILGGGVDSRRRFYCWQLRQFCDIFVKLAQKCFFLWIRILISWFWLRIFEFSVTYFYICSVVLIFLDFLPKICFEFRVNIFAFLPFSWIKKYMFWGLVWIFDAPFEKRDINIFLFFVPLRRNLDERRLSIQILYDLNT